MYTSKDMHFIGLVGQCLTKVGRQCLCLLNFAVSLLFLPEIQYGNVFVQSRDTYLSFYEFRGQYKCRSDDTFDPILLFFNNNNKKKYF